MTTNWTRNYPGNYTATAPEFHAEVVRDLDGIWWTYVTLFGRHASTAHHATMAEAKRGAESCAATVAEATA
jgi:hypothetical protein